MKLNCWTDMEWHENKNEDDMKLQGMKLIWMNVLLKEWMNEWMNGRMHELFDWN